MNIINPFTVVGSFALLLAGLAYFNPRLGQKVTGVFFLLMALGVNLPILLTNPDLYVQMGNGAFLPLYRWFFSTILATYTIPLGFALIVFEITTGILILFRGKAMLTGLLMASVFCIFVTPLGIEEITAPLLMISFAILALKNQRTPTTQASPVIPTT